MNCCPCWNQGPPSPDGRGDGAGPSAPAHPPLVPPPLVPPPSRADSAEMELDDLPEVEGVLRFRFSELADTRYLEDANFLGQGAFGKVYKGYLPSGRPIALKFLKREGIQDVEEFIKGVSIMSSLDHPNIVRLLGFSANNGERVLVYEYMSKGTLDRWLTDPPLGRETLDWNRRVRIAQEAAKGLLYLHETPQIIHGNLKSANILLDDDFNAKISDSGLAKCGPAGVVINISTRIVGTPVYCAPEYFRIGRLSNKSDVYSFGVILLELLTGRTAKAPGTESLVQWASRFLDDRSNFARLADPLLDGRYPEDGFGMIAEVTSTCIRDNPRDRPRMQEVVGTLEHLASQTYVPRGKGHVRSNQAFF